MRWAAQDFARARNIQRCSDSRESGISAAHLRLDGFTYKSKGLNCFVNLRILSDGMVRSLLGIVLAFAIFGAPLARVACATTCADRDAQAPISHHSCHEQTPSDHSVDITAIHVCGHDDSTQTALERDARNLVPLAVVQTIQVAVTSGPINSVRIATVHSSPPTSLKVISQLRV